MRFSVCRSLALALAAGLSLHAADPAKAPTAEGVVTLPKFEVTDSQLLPERESWRYARIPGFEILSATSARNTQVFVREFSRLQQVLGAVWPTIRQEVPEVPVSIIMCDKDKNFADFFPEERKIEAEAHTCEFYQENESATIVVDFGKKQLFQGVINSQDVSNANAEVLDQGLTELSQGEDPMLAPESNMVRAGATQADPIRDFRRSYIQFLLKRAAGGRLPDWFREGLSQILVSIDYTKTYIEVGRVGDVDGVRADDFNAALSELGLMPMEELFAGCPKEGLAAQYIWRKQCQAFVHWCLYGEYRKHAAGLARLLQQTQGRIPSDADFWACFDMGFEDMEITLRGYIQYTQHTYGAYKVAKGEVLFDKPEDLKLEEATDAQVGRIKGEALRLSGQLELGRSFIIAPYVRGEKDPELLSVLGLAEKELGKSERARRFLMAAVQGGTVRSRAYVELAGLLLKEFETNAKGAPLTVEQVLMLQKLLVKAYTLPPLLPELFEIGATSWLGCAQNPNAEQYNFVFQGALRYPSRLRLVYMVAQVGAKAGYAKQALALIEHGERYSPTAKGKALFSQLRKDFPALSQPPTEVPAASPTPAPQPAKHG